MGMIGVVGRHDLVDGGGEVELLQRLEGTMSRCRRADGDLDV